MKIRLLLVTLLAVAMAGCVSGDRHARRPSAAEVLAWAHLDDMLGHHVDLIKVGQADGKAILGDYVLVQDGETLVSFVKKHGYRSFRGPVAARSFAMRVEVDVEITGADGARCVVTLWADGGLQGAG